jgi:hypothetical protein
VLPNTGGTAGDGDGAASWQALLLVGALAIVGGGAAFVRRGASVCRRPSHT